MPSNNIHSRRAASNKAYLNRRKKGLCAYCSLRATHGVMCDDHHSKQVSQRKKQTSAWRAAGLCTRCGGGPPEEGGLRCAPCAKSQRDSSLKYRYGLTAEEVLAIVLRQGGCGVCRRKTPDGAGWWHVDHDHKTNKVRGVLCGTCNTGLGKLGDSTDRLRAALKYLEHAA
jgi:hypothetical protein